MFQVTDLFKACISYTFHQGKYSIRNANSWGFHLGLLKKMDIWHISQNMERQEKDSWSFIEIFIPPSEFQEIPYYT